MVERRKRPEPPTPEPSSRSAAGRPPRRPVRVTCPACGTRFQTRGRTEPSETPCLACDKPVPVPGRQGVLATTADSAPVAPPPAVHGPNVFDAMAEERFGGEVHRPTWPFLSGTFTFPWYPEVIFRWVALSLGCSLVVVLYVAMHWGFSRGGWFARAGYAFGFPLGWIGIWTFSYAASCGSVILTETAAGNDRVSGWPDPDWREWVGDLLALLPAILTAMALAFVAGRLSLLLGGPFWASAGLTLFVLLPMCLLSTVEAHTAFVPFSPLILKSLAFRAGAWLRFYAASGALALLWPGSLILGYQREPFYAAIVTGPLMAISLLVYPRLLGRLGGCIAELQGE